LPRYIEDYHTHIRKLAETHPATTVIYTLSLHDALPISTTKSGPPSVDPPPVLHCGALRTTHGPATVRSSRTTPLPYPLWKQELLARCAAACRWSPRPRGRRTPATCSAERTSSSS